MFNLFFLRELELNSNSYFGVVGVMVTQGIVDPLISVRFWYFTLYRRLVLTDSILISKISGSGSNPEMPAIGNNIFGWFGIHRRTLLLVEHKCGRTQPKGKYIYYIQKVLQNLLKLSPIVDQQMMGTNYNLIGSSMGRAAA